MTPVKVSKVSFVVIIDTSISDAGVYAAFTGGEILFNLLAYFVAIAHNINASRALHRNMLSKVIRAPTNFYDVTPLGR